MPKPPKRSESPKKTVYLVFGVALGAAIGTSLGMVLHNPAVGIAIGAGVGVALGAGLMSRRGGDSDGMGKPGD